MAQFSFEGEGVQLDIIAPKGTPAAWIKGAIGGSEDELLLGRGIRMKIVKISQDGKKITLRIEGTATKAERAKAVKPTIKPGTVETKEVDSQSLGKLQRLQMEGWKIKSRSNKGFILERVAK